MSLSRPFEQGEEVWLTPRTLWAPGIAYKQPHGIIAVGSKVGSPVVTVTLDDGQAVEIHADNVTRTEPKPRKAPARTPLPECDGTALCPLRTTAKAVHAIHEQGALW